MAANRKLDLGNGTGIECKTISKEKFLIDGVSEALLSIVQFEDGTYGVVKSFNGHDTILYSSTRVSELRHFAVCQLAQAQAFVEIAEKAHLGEQPRKIGRPKGSTKVPPKGKYGSGKPRRVENLTINGEAVQ